MPNAGYSTLIICAQYQPATGRISAAYPPVPRHPGSDFLKRNQAALSFIPQHQPHTPKTLQQRDAADIAQFGVVVQHA